MPIDDVRCRFRTCYPTEVLALDLAALNYSVKGDFPKWRVCMQVMTEAQAAAHYENPFDVTKTWSQKEFPLIEIGELELNRNPLNYFAEVEQAAFGPSNMIPGAGA